MSGRHVEMHSLWQFSKILQGYNKFNESPFIGSWAVASRDTHAEFAKFWKGCESTKKNK
jgi:hypothetical protein